MATDTRLYWIWMQEAVGRGNPLGKKLLETFGGPEAVYNADRAALMAAGVKRKADLKALCDKSLRRARAVLSYTLDCRDWILTPADSYYPEQLRAIDAPPLVLYGRGEPPRLQDVPTLTIVGTRYCSSAGVYAAEKLAAVAAAAGITVISGGAVGIDAAAHRGALRAGGVTVLLMPCSLDVSYPRENAALRRSIVMNGGALLTEYAPTAKAYKSHFRERNRILSGLSLATCVVEAPKRSGALMTAGFAREQGRDVYSVPGDIDRACCKGSNALLRKGAAPLCSGRDLLEEFSPRWGNRLNSEAARYMEETYKAAGPAVKEKQRAPAARAARWEKPKTAAPAERTCPDYLSPDAKTVFAGLGESPLPVDELAAKCGLPVPRVMAALTELELAGCVSPAAGQMYARPKD